MESLPCFDRIREAIVYLQCCESIALRYEHAGRTPPAMSAPEIVPTRKDMGVI